MDRIFGKLRAYVTNNEDPLKIGRVRCIAPRFDPDVELPWALPNFPIAGLNDFGEPRVPPCNAWIWIEFEAGDPEAPIWTGCFYTKEGDYPQTPKVATDRDDLSVAARGNIPATLTNGAEYEPQEESLKFKRNTEIVQSRSEIEIPEPQSRSNSQYPYNNMFKSTSGHVIETDDTPGYERLAWFHRKGTYREVAPDGSKTDKVVARHDDIVFGDEVKHVVGNRYKAIDGDTLINYGKTKHEVIRRRRITIINGSDRTVSGAKTEHAQGEWYIKASGKRVEQFTAGREIMIIGGDSIINAGDKSSVVTGDVDERIGGDYSLQILSGDYSIDIANGSFNFYTLLGALSFNNALGGLDIDASGNITIKGATSVKLGGDSAIDPVMTVNKFMAGFVIPLAEAISPPGLPPTPASVSAALVTFMKSLETAYPTGSLNAVLGSLKVKADL